MAVWERVNYVYFLKAEIGRRKIYYNVVSVAAGEKQGYTKQFSR
jgi:hypothetical protein